MRKLNRSPVMDWLRKGIVAAISLGSVVMCGCGGPPVDPDRGVSGPRSLTIKCIGGEIRAEPSGVVYDEWGATHRFPSNSRVTLSINDIDRYPCPMCIHWHGGELDGTIQDGLTVTMDSDKQFRAVIQMGHLREPEVTYLMFLTYKDKGRLWVAPPGRLLSHGEMVSFDPGQGVVVRAIPDDGLSFVGYWADDVTGFWPERRLRMSRDTVLLAFFDEEDPLDPRLDADGIFDAWQSEYGLPTDAASGATDDPDKDGLTNAEEERAFTDPASADTDGDGLPDRWELMHRLDPLVGKSDKSWERPSRMPIFSKYPPLPGSRPIAGSGDHGANGDPDKDGKTNAEEFAAGTFPDDDESIDRWYLLTVLGGGGDGEKSGPDCGAGWYPEGTAVQVTVPVAANDAVDFRGWLCADGDQDQAPHVKMDRHIICQALFR